MRWYIIILLFVLSWLPNGAIAVDTTTQPTEQQWQQLTNDKAFGYKTEKELAEKKKAESPGLHFYKPPWASRCYGCCSFFC
jgi:hypothetical protein